MTAERLKEILREIYCEENGDSNMEVELNEDTNIIEDLNFDSIMYLKILVAIEEETGVELDDEDIDDIAVFRSLLDRINRDEV